MSSSEASKADSSSSSSSSSSVHPDLRFIMGLDLNNEAHARVWTLPRLPKTNAWIKGSPLNFEPRPEDSSSSSACEKVFTKHKLAEAIFLGLPPTQLLTKVQRTCKQWKAVIDTSTPLQQVLFFKPIPGQAEAYLETFPWKWNVKPASWMASRRSTKASDHPLFRKVLEMSVPYEGDWTAMHRPNASWRKMLCSQPPFKSFGRDRFNGRWETFVEDHGDGVKLGDLMEAFRVERFIGGLPNQVDCSSSNDLETKQYWKERAARELLAKWEKKEEKKKTSRFFP